ncbi:hypothetical protein BDZ89DRAFT_1044878 [Hymenopellis radicata]|nr:hypothetical protein BDZ89DRAFT_1044878 [Hymenopellis radicata]
MFRSSGNLVRFDQPEFGEKTQEKAKEEAELYKFDVVVAVAKSYIPRRQASTSHSKPTQTETNSSALASEMCRLPRGEIVGEFASISTVNLTVFALVILRLGNELHSESPDAPTEASRHDDGVPRDGQHGFRETGSMWLELHVSSIEDSVRCPVNIPPNEDGSFTFGQRDVARRGAKVYIVQAGIDVQQSKKVPVAA